VSNDRSGHEERFLAALGEAIGETTDIPPEFLQAGYTAYAWYSVDAELAELTYDSATGPAGESTFVGARGGSEQLRSMTFVATSFRVDIEVTSGRLKGQVQPRPNGRMQLVTGDGAADVEVDRLGWFDIHSAPPGLFQLRWLDPDDEELLVVPIELT
jgi:hypothetical protein